MTNNARRFFKTWISIYGICIVGMSICLLVILTSKRQVKELKQEFEDSIETIDSLANPIDTAVIWFDNHRVINYESIDTMVAHYDHGVELNIYFKYTN